MLELLEKCPKISRCMCKKGQNSYPFKLPISREKNITVKPHFSEE